MITIITDTPSEILISPLSLINKLIYLYYNNV